MENTKLKFFDINQINSFNEFINQFNSNFQNIEYFTTDAKIKTELKLQLQREAEEIALNYFTSKIQ